MAIVPRGLLQPLSLPNKVWDEVTMDFIEGLPRSDGYTVILVAVDSLSKYAYFIPLTTQLYYCDGCSGVYA